MSVVFLGLYESGEFVLSDVIVQEAEKLLGLVGGKDNVATVTHCITRLRFVLKDPEKPNIKAIEKLSSVKGVFNNAGQFQVIIGPQVGDFYKAMTGEAGISAASKEAVKEVARQNMSLLERSISHLAEIFVPLLPAIICGGLILGFRNLIGDIALINGKTLIQVSQMWAGIHSFLWLLGEAIFHFLPVGVCWSVVRKMGGSPILGIVLGITLVSPQLMNAYNIGKTTPDVWDFGWFVMEKVGYQAQVIPALMAGAFLAWFEVRLRKLIPDYLHLVVIPFVALTATVLLAHALIGPLGRSIGDGVAVVVLYILTGPFAILGYALFGFFYAPLVITGVHHTTNAIELQLMQQIGGTMIFPLLALSNIAQGSAALGVAIMNKDKVARELSIPSVISAWLGVTEPAMYGVNLKYRFPMLCAMIGSACAATVAGFFAIQANGIGVGGIPGILSVKPDFWGVFLICMLIAIIIPVVLTMIVYRRKQALGELEELNDPELEV